MKTTFLKLILVGLTLMFCLTEVTLSYFLPLAKTHFDVWLDYFIKKDAAYDIMFFAHWLILYFCVKNISIDLRAITAFGVIVSGGSFIDKVIFDLNQYLLSDIVLIIIAGLCSFYIKYKSNGRLKDVVN